MPWVVVDECAAAMRATPSSGPTQGVHAARHELHSFFAQTYHLKNALIAEGAVPKQSVERAIILFSFEIGLTQAV